METLWTRLRQASEGPTLPWSKRRRKCLTHAAHVNVSKMSGGTTHGDLRSIESSVASARNPEQRRGTTQIVSLPEESVEVVKVYLDNRPETTDSVRMLTDEVSQIQEVRYCLKTLREQMAARQNNNVKKYPANGYTVHNTAPIGNGNNNCNNYADHNEDVENHVQNLREETKRLHAQIEAMESRHREERHRLQAESEERRADLATQSERLRRAEAESVERGRRVEGLQRLLGNTEAESGLLRDRVAAERAELLRLRAQGGEGKEEEDRCSQLETEVALHKEKIHHLDDMLKSQQRKVRQMIEQLQNSRTVLQERDRTIGDLEEKMAFLEAENRELHDHMEHLLSGREPPPLKSAENKPVVIYSKPLMPSTHGNKSLPFIKVIEIKS
ncbi:tuftelin 1b isoform X2 [Stigmatopora argus]